MLAGPRVRLLLVPRDVARLVAAGADPRPALADHGLTAAVDWPHDDSADALRGVAELPVTEPAVGSFLVLDEADVVIGDAGVVGPPDVDGDSELGYGLAASRRGEGLMTEAVTVLCAWAERQPDVRRLVARVRPGNEASARVLLRVGFELQGPDPHDRGHVLWVRGRGGRSAVRLTGRHVC